MTTAQLADGTQLEFPDGTSQEVISRVVKQHLSGNAPHQAAKQDTSLSTKAINTAAKYIYDTANTGFGALRGAAGIGATIAQPFQAMAGGALGNNAEMRANLDKNLQSAGANPDADTYKGGKLASEIAITYPIGGAVGNAVSKFGAPMLGSSIASGGMTLGTDAVQGLSKGQALAQALTRGGTRVAGGAINGGLQAGAINPDDAGVGALIGGAIPIAAKVAGTAGNAITRPFAGADNTLADKAINQYNIPLGSVDVGNSKMAKALRSLLNDTPIVGRSGAADKQAITGAFNNAVGKTFGADATSLTPDVMQDSVKRLGDNYNRIYANNTLKLNNGLSTDLQDIADEATKKLNPYQAATVQRHIDNLKGAAKNGIINGEFANNWQSELRQVVDGETGLQKSILNKLRQKTLSAFNDGISGADADLLKQTNQQYKALKTIQPLMIKGEAGVAGRDLGDVPASLLPNQVAKQYVNNIANSPFEDLSRIGSKFIADRVEKTGGSNRALIQNSAIGAGMAGAAYTNPMAAAITLPIATGVNKLMGSPKIAKVLLSNSMNSPSAKSKMLADMLQQAVAKSAPVLSAQ